MGYLYDDRFCKKPSHLKGRRIKMSTAKTHHTFSEEFIEKVYEKIVKKDESYFKKHSAALASQDGCPSSRWRHSWKGKDFPRCICILDFKEWYVKHFGNEGHTFRHLGYTHEGDPELDFTLSFRRTRLDYPPYDLHTIFDVKNGVSANENLREAFDFFIFNQTLEHLYNPFKAVKNIYEMIKPGGYVFTSVPTLNIPHLMPFHFNGFTPIGLAMLFLSCGFEILEIGQFGNEDYIRRLWETHEWPDYEYLKSVAPEGKGENIPNEERNVCQCWILAKKSFHETSYEDTFSDLNPSFGKNDNDECLKLDRNYDGMTEYTFKRGPLRIFGKNEDEVYKFLSRRFGKSEKVLRSTSGHSLIYRKQCLTFDYRDDFGGEKIVIDVNYKWSDTYYHFMTEVVPNVLFALSKLEEMKSSYTRENIIIFTKINPEFTLQWFEWFGVTARCLLITDNIEHVYWKGRVKCRYVECGNISPERVNLIQNAVRPRQLETITSPQRIGILMQRCGDREILNEDEVLETLQNTFKDEIDRWVVFTTLPPQKTVSLFASASVIVGPHGAGFTNLLFCNPEKVKVVELAPVAHAYVCYWHLSEVLKVKDYSMIAFSNCDSNYRFFVDCEELRKLILSK